MRNKVIDKILLQSPQVCWCYTFSPQMCQKQIETEQCHKQNAVHSPLVGQCHVHSLQACNSKPTHTGKNKSQQNANYNLLGCAKIKFILHRCAKKKTQKNMDNFTLHKVICKTVISTDVQILHSPQVNQEFLHTVQNYQQSIQYMLHRCVRNISTLYRTTCKAVTTFSTGVPRTPPLCRTNRKSVITFSTQVWNIPPLYRTTAR